MQIYIEFTEDDWDLSPPELEKMAVKGLEMFDGKDPVRTLDVAIATGRDYGTVRTHLPPPANAVS